MDLPAPFCPQTKILGHFLVDIVSSASSQETGYIVRAIGEGEWKRIWKVLCFGDRPKVEIVGDGNRFSANGHIRQISSIPESNDLRVIVELSDAGFFDLSPFITGKEWD